MLNADFKNKLLFNGNLCYLVKYYEGTISAENFWVEFSIDGITSLNGKKLAQFPSFIASVNATSANDFYVTGIRRDSDKSFTVIFNKPRTSAFQIAVMFLVVNE